MKRQQQWNIYEAVILLDAFLKIKSSSLTRSEAIHSVSTQLRKMAKNNGIEIDDIYRNINGITFQMESMESAYYGKTIIKPATHLFAEVVSIYKTNPLEYSKLLKEAQAMSSEQKMTNEETFVTWLASKVSPAQLLELYDTYKDIEKFCRKVKVIRGSLFETLDYATARKIQQTIESNKAFRFSHKWHMSKYISAASYYCKYVKELESENKSYNSHNVDENSTVEVSPRSDASSISYEGANNFSTEENTSEQVKAVLKKECAKNPLGITPIQIQSFFPEIHIDDIKSILFYADWAKYESGAYIYLESSETVDDSIFFDSPKPPTSLADNKIHEIHTIDFNNIPELVYTKPILLSYFGETNENLHSWTELYTIFFTALYENYSHILKVGMSFTRNNDGRVEFGDAETAKVMKAPKPIPVADGEKYYLETNLSAYHLVGKIKFLLDLCSVDYENVVIQYDGSDTIQKTQPTVSVPNNGSNFQDDFSQWLLQKGYSPSTVRNYISAIKHAELYAKKYIAISSALVTSDHSLRTETAKALFQKEDFVEFNKHHHNRLSAAIGKLLEYYETSNNLKAVTNVPRTKVQNDHINTEPFEKVLAKKFVRGFRIGSPLDMKKFRRFYEEINGEATELSDMDIEATLQSCGIYYGDKVFSPTAMLSEEVRDKLFSSIRVSFNEGKQAVYYEALFRSFSEEFLDYYIYDAQMLKAYISFYNNDEFHLEGKYICKDALTQVNPAEEVKNYLITAGLPVENIEIFETLSHIPQKKIMQILGASDEFVYNGKNQYFHVNIVHLSEEEIENVADLIKTGINEKLFLSGNELIAMIRARYPFIIENNQPIFTIGMRDALKYHLKERFSFKGNIISSLDQSLSMTDVFESYAKSRPEFTVNELTTLASEMNSTIYFDAVYDNSLRINQEQFVAKNREQFRIEETDRAIDRFCNGDYIAIGKIDNFGLFPDAGFPWNIYLLEHYVYAYSKKYSLFHVCFNRDCCVGAIVKKESGIQTFDELFATALAQSDITLKREQALAFLVKEGYLARRMYSNIEKVLIQANTYRNRKGTK